jgi:Rieske Fe-S protein
MSTTLSRRLNRRRALACLLALPALRTALAQGSNDKSIAYRDLKEPVEVPDPGDVWQPIEFDAWVGTLPEDGLDVPELLLRGMVLRVPEERGDESIVHAFCRLCPHEICQVDFLPDARHVRVDAATPPSHPMLFCVCHESVFDPLAGGARIGGPATRGLFLFSSEARRGMIRVTAVEESILKRLGELL